MEQLSGQKEGISNQKKSRRSNNIYWREGEPLTEQDRVMLQVVQQIYKKQGFTPSKREVPNAAALKRRFRTWTNVMKAAEIPLIKEPEQTRKRQASAAWKKTMKL